MNAMMMMIPIGFRFNPSDEEVIGGYLWSRVVGKELPWNGVAEKEIYGAHPPWEVFSDDGDFLNSKIEGGATKKITYVFTTLTRASKTKISRRAGSGTWKGQITPKKIISSDTGEIIGHMRSLSFEPDANANAATPPPDHSGHWTMHEYYLSKDMAKKSGNPNAADIVICKITKIIKNNNMIPTLSPPPPPPQEEQSSSSDSAPPSKKQKINTLMCGEGSLPSWVFDDNIDIDELWLHCFQDGAAEGSIIPVEGSSAALPNWDSDVIDIDTVFGPDYQLPIDSY